MMESILTAGTWFMGFLALATMMSLFSVTAPYGRHFKPGIGPIISTRWGWILMESPSVFLFAAVVAFNPPKSVFGWLLVGMWEWHYVYRTFIFSSFLRRPKKPMPLSIVLTGFCFNLLNSTINAFALHMMDQPAGAYFYLSILGILVFFVGFYIHVRSDYLLQTLRKQGENGYKIPKGFLFDLVVSPNYLGEIVQWTGFALASQTLPAWMFAFYTVANLLPRALSHRQWYQDNFKEFSPRKKALIPWLL